MYDFACLEEPIWDYDIRNPTPKIYDVSLYDFWMGLRQEAAIFADPSSLGRNCD